MSLVANECRVVCGVTPSRPARVHADSNPVRMESYGFPVLVVKTNSLLAAFIVEVDIQTQTVSSPGTDDPASLDEMDGGEW